jgi:site-specific recombinase XerD
MIEAGVPTLTVQQLVGHSSSHMTGRYTHVSISTKAQAVESVFGTYSIDN